MNTTNTIKPGGGGGAILKSWTSQALFSTHIFKKQLLEMTTVSGRNCQRSQLAAVATVSSRNCQRSQLSAVATVSGRNCQRSQLSAVATVSGRNCQRSQMSGVATASIRNCQVYSELLLFIHYVNFVFIFVNFAC